MPKYFTWVAGLRGPEPQLCYEEPVDGAGKPKPCLDKVKLDDKDKRTFRELIRDFPVPGEVS